MANKMTNVKALESVLDNAEVVALLTNEVVEKLEAIKTSFEKKKKSKKLTKTQEANLETKEVILSLLNSEVGQTVTELLANDELSGLTNQKITALLGQLARDGLVTKKMDKRKSYYFAVGTSAAEVETDVEVDDDMGEGENA